LYAFPRCIDHNGHKPLPLCREDCIAVRNLLCVNDWALIEENNQQHIFLKSRGHFRLPNCSDLPLVNKTAAPTNVTSPFQPPGTTCSHAKLTEMRMDLVTSKLLNCNH